MRDIIVVDFTEWDFSKEAYVSEFLGTCSLGDETRYVRDVAKRFGLNRSAGPINLSLFTWEHDGISQYTYLPKLVQKWVI